MATLADLKILLAARGTTLAAGPAESAASPAAPAAPHGGPPAHAEGARKELITKRLLAAAKHADADIDFATAVGAVTPISCVRRAPSTRPVELPVPRQHLADEEDALYASKFGAEPSPQSWDIGQEIEGEQTFLRAGLGPDVLTKLRRGHWSVQSELDLHGQTSAEAHDTLADFLAEARQHELRCVRVIHGKGLSSPGGEPVLKGKVRRWLAHWDGVLAYAEAPQHAGGAGAVLVLLRPPRR